MQILSFNKRTATLRELYLPKFQMHFIFNPKFCSIDFAKVELLTKVSCKRIIASLFCKIMFFSKECFKLDLNPLLFLNPSNYMYKLQCTCIRVMST